MNCTLGNGSVLRSNMTFILWLRPYLLSGLFSNTKQGLSALQIVSADRQVWKGISVFGIHPSGESLCC